MRKFIVLSLTGLSLLPSLAIACSVADPSDMGCKPYEEFSTFTCKCEPLQTFPTLVECSQNATTSQKCQQIETPEGLAWIVTVNPASPH
jgi:hypothetical protein